MSWPFRLMQINSYHTLYNMNWQIMSLSNANCRKRMTGCTWNALFHLFSATSTDMWAFFFSFFPLQTEGRARGHTVNNITHSCLYRASQDQSHRHCRQREVQHIEWHHFEKQKDLSWRKLCEVCVCVCVCVIDYFKKKKEEKSLLQHQSIACAARHHSSQGQRWCTQMD